MVEMEAKVQKDSVSLPIAQAKEIYDSGWYGEVEGKRLVLNLMEAAYLFERGKIEIKGGFREFFHFCVDSDKEFIPKFAVYRDMRERGLVVRSGFKGIDFRIYERGAKPHKAKLKWIVFVSSEDWPCRLEKLGKATKLAKNIRAEALWGVVDNDLDATYYVITQPVSL